MARKAAASKRRGGAARKSTSRRKSPGASRRTTTASPRRRWSRDVTEHSDALTLEGGVFTSKDPSRIAASLKRSAERSRRRKADPFRSALSMLTFYINRAGKNLPAARKKILMQAKDELRKQFGKDLRRGAPCDPNRSSAPAFFIRRQSSSSGAVWRGGNAGRHDDP